MGLFIMIEQGMRQGGLRAINLQVLQGKANELSFAKCNHSSEIGCVIRS